MTDYRKASQRSSGANEDGVLPHSTTAEEPRQDDEGGEVLTSVIFHGASGGPCHVTSGFGAKLISTDGPTWFCGTKLNLTRLISPGLEPDRPKLSLMLHLGKFVRCSPTP